jgi:hypothetical protein
VEDITDFGKEGKQPVLTLKGKKENSEWYIIASFVIAKGQVTSVEMEVKSCSDLRPEIRVWFLLFLSFPLLYLLPPCANFSTIVS